MGRALIVMTTAEERLSYDALREFNEKGEMVAIKRPKGWFTAEVREKFIAEHPDAFWLMPVPFTAVWEMPEEPPHEPSWHWDRARLTEHRRKVRASLETFINESLEQLDHMLRSGWFIIKEARVKATLQGVAHDPLEFTKRAERRKERAATQRLQASASKR